MPAPYAAHLPALEPTDQDLIDLLTLPWEETQSQLERLLVEAERIEQRRAATDDAEAAIHTLPTSTVSNAGLEVAA